VFKKIFLLKMGYPPNEIVDMIRIVGEAGNNYSATARLYSIRFSDRHHPNRKVMKRLSEPCWTPRHTQTHMNENVRVRMKLRQWLLLLALC